MRAAALVLACVPALAGCSVLELELDAPLDLAACEELEQRGADRTEVLAVLGPPSALAAHGDGVALLYEHVTLDEGQLGFGLSTVGTLLGAAWLSVFKVSLGGSGSRREAAVFLFDGAGALAAAGTAEWSEEFGRGGNVQFIATVEQVVDAGTLRGTPYALTWGRDLLEPPDRALNQPHRPALELRGTPDRAGQHALELGPRESRR